jgi:MoxR-like ATPase
MHPELQRLRDNIARVLFGHPGSIDRLICCLLARGHALIEDVPGVGKTVLASALSRSVDCTFSRIQLTPDTLPGDVLGVSIYDKTTGSFVYKRGPIFANIVLADEINRTPPRTQAALLEAMAEATVSVDGHTIPLDQPFMVIATQNPYDFEGTYALPENQLDRFLVRLSLGYPSPADEARILRERPSNSPLHTLQPVITRDTLLDLQAKVDKVHIDQTLLDYIVMLATASRGHEGLLHGLSPRGSLALAQMARASALYQGRDYVVPDDIIDNAVPVIAHRVVTKRSMTESAGVSAGERIVDDIVRAVPNPT